MTRGFGAGVLWGLVVAVLGLGTWSQLAPPPEAVIRAQEAAEAARVAAEEQAAAVAAAAQAAAEAAAAEAARVAAAEEAAARAALEEALAAEAAAAALAKADPPALAEAGPEGPAAGEATPAPEVPAPGEDLPSLAGLDQALSQPSDEAAPAPAEPAPAAPEGSGDVLAQPGQPEGVSEPEALPEVAPAEAAEPMPVPEVAEPLPEALPEPSPAPAPQEDGASLAGTGPQEDKLPTTVLDKEVPGVKTGKLPQIGVAPEAEALAEVEPALAEELPPVERFARGFVPEGKPLFAILLRDVGPGGVARKELAALPFAVSFVIDPLAPDAAEAAAVYRGAGQEVVMLANGLPLGASAGDVETTFGALARVLPEAVALIDQDLGGFQDHRPLATLVLPVIAGQGRGLVTYDRGLNAADQIARRAGVPAAVIFRRLDGEGESRPVMRRYLDRAAFKAAQEGAVVVIGDTRPETVAAILEWTVEGKAATVSLAPITAVMAR